MVEKITLRPTLPSDLNFVLNTERHSANASFIGQWPAAQHEAALAAADIAHLIARHHQPIGYVILTGLTSAERTVNLRRIVAVEKGQGYGRAILRQAKAYAFETAGAHRFWLDVIVSNERARSLYESEGFVLEGTLRDAWKTADGYEDMLIMSMLEKEYAASL
ncbi:MAG: GNAT family protein [Phormidesmis sp.]